MVRKINLTPIGYVDASVTEPVDENWGNVTSRINLLPEYKGSMSGLETFSHAIVVTYLHRAKYIPSRHLRRRPRGMRSMPEVGIFSQRVKDRPNPIGVTAVAIISVGDLYIDVCGLDAINATPVLDIKPYFPQFDKIESPQVPDWVNKLMKNYF